MMSIFIEVTVYVRLEIRDAKNYKQKNERIKWLHANELKKSKVLRIIQLQKLTCHHFAEYFESFIHFFQLVL